MKKSHLQRFQPSKTHPAFTECMQINYKTSMQREDAGKKRELPHYLRSIPQVLSVSVFPPPCYGRELPAKGPAPSAALARWAATPQNVQPEMLGRVKLQVLSSQHVGSISYKSIVAAGLKHSLKVMSLDTARSLRGASGSATCPWGGTAVGPAVGG